MIAVLLWAFVASTWVFAYMYYQDLGEWGKPDFTDYAIVAIAGVTLTTLTILLALLTMCEMGIVE